MIEKSTTKPVRKPVSLRSIATNTHEFQFRHVDADPNHVSDLAAVLIDGNPLDPLTLWRDPESNKLVVVDGHHRLAAYKQAGWRKHVPARTHNCSLEQARLLALRENGKTRLALTNEERLDAAWKLVCLDATDYSKRVIVKETGTSDGTVANMRRTRAALIKRDPDAVLPDRWWDALATLKGREQREYTEEEREAMIEAKTAKLDEQIGKELGFMAANQIEAAAAVVAKRLGRRGLAFLLEEYGEEFDPYGLNEDDEAVSANIWPQAE